MRFDDSLATVLATDSDSITGASSAWRQLVDLVGRGRAANPDMALARLRDLRSRVPDAVRIASARALATVTPPASLVALFAKDTIAVAAPVLRHARLRADEWLALLPELSPPARALLRHRRDLPSAAMRGLESFGATDFVLQHNGASAAAAITPPAARQLSPLQPRAPDPIEPSSDPAFQIADLVARIDAFRRDQPVPAPVEPLTPPACFQLFADGAGVIRWVEGVARTPLIGVALTRTGRQGVVTVGSEVVDAFRRRAALRNGELHVIGESTAAGRWCVAVEPRFDRVTAHFTGMAGTARRIADARAGTTAADSLRQLVHELRTPANAITGFAELIGSELLGPVPTVYRDRAALIQRQGSALTEAVADLDAAARIEDDAFDTRPAAFDLAAVVATAVADLQTVAQARHCRLTLLASPAVFALADGRAARRLVERLLAAVVAAALPGEQVQAHVVVKPRSVRLHLTRPRTLPDGEEQLLSIDGAVGGDDLLPLGVGFTLQLVRSLAGALGGSFTIAADRLTLRLPTAVTAQMEQASNP